MWLVVTKSDVNSKLDKTKQKDHIWFDSFLFVFFCFGTPSLSVGNPNKLDWMLLLNHPLNQSLPRPLLSLSLSVCNRLVGDGCELLRWIQLPAHHSHQHYQQKNIWKKKKQQQQQLRMVQLQWSKVKTYTTANFLHFFLVNIHTFLIDWNLHSQTHTHTHTHTVNI